MDEQNDQSPTELGWWLTWARYSECAECATVQAHDEADAKRRVAELKEFNETTDGPIVSQDAEH